MPIRFPWSRKKNNKNNTSRKNNNKNNTSRKNNNKTSKNENNNTSRSKRQNTSLNLLTHIKKLNIDFLDAVLDNNLDKVEKLLREGADINIRYSKATDFEEGDNVTPVQYAASSGNTKLLEFLVIKGADLNLSDAQGQNPLLAATIGDNYDIVKFLLDNGANINAKDDNGRTALMIASNQGNRKIVELLLDKDAKIDETNKKNATALMYATYSIRKDIIKLLIDKGADIDKKNIDGQTALDTARKNGLKKIIELFYPEMDLSKYPNGGTKEFSEGEENSISYDEYKKGDKVVVITKNEHEFMYLMKSLQDAWNAKGYPYNPSSNEPLKKSDEKNIKRHTLI